MLKKKKIIALISILIFIVLYFALYYLITFNGAGVQPEGFFVSMNRFRFDPTEFYSAYFEISTWAVLIPILLVFLYGVSYLLLSDKRKFQKISFYITISFLIITTLLSINTNFNISEGSIVLVSYFLNILAFKNYLFSCILLIFMIYPLINYKKGKYDDSMLKKH